MSLALVQGYDEDPEFCGIVFVSKKVNGSMEGYDGCNHTGMMDHPHSFAEKSEMECWLCLHDDSDTIGAFTGETKLRDGKLWGRVWWE